MNNLNSDIYKAKTKKNGLYNIMPIANIPSVMEMGILCYKKMEKIKHNSVAIDAVQEIREKKCVPNGLYLHEYANLYFDARNPMMYKRRAQAELLCVLKVYTEVLDIADAIIADSNAANDYVRFYTATEGINNLDYDTIFMRSWTDNDIYKEKKQRSIKCAEVLIPEKIPYSYVFRACVFDEVTKMALEERGFDKKIDVNPDMFFRR